MALWTVYIVWGSTYLAIRVAVETLPPLLHASVRFLLAGLVMYLFLLLKGGWARVRVSPSQLGASVIVGTSLLLGGNGLVAIAEQEVPSGLAALIIASVPLWVVVLRAIFGDRVSGGTLLGVVVGFAGVGILVLSGGGAAGAQTAGILLLVLASVAWATGSFCSSRLPLPGDPFVSTAVQMLGGGLVLGVASLLTGEFTGLNFESFSLASVLAVAYLVVAGSLAAFTAYTWLLKNAPISKVSTYAYVNPVVAVFLGWLILAEEITVPIVAGAAIIVAAVAFIVRHEAAGRAEIADRGEPAAAPPSHETPVPSPASD
ncbi:MAG: EamA family transporter [Actinomycetota bacterium]|nr:EamA family transporter [Actinomycetota bacterium]